METGQAALLFLYGLFWAEILATTARYNGFPTAKLWVGSDTRGDRSIWVRRLIVSFVVLNFFPILWLVFLYQYVVPATPGAAPIAVAAMSSLSIFGIIRLYHGIVASKDSLRYFSTDAELRELEVQGPSGCPLTVWSHVVPGAVYLVVLPGLAMVARWLWV